MKLQISVSGREGGRKESRQVRCSPGIWELQAQPTARSSRYLNLGCLSDPATLKAKFWSGRSGWVEGQAPGPALGGWKLGGHTGKSLLSKKLSCCSAVSWDRGWLRVQVKMRPSIPCHHSTQADLHCHGQPGFLSYLNRMSSWPTCYLL